MDRLGFFLFLFLVFGVLFSVEGQQLGWLGNLLVHILSLPFLVVCYEYHARYDGMELGVNEKKGMYIGEEKTGSSIYDRFAGKDPETDSHNYYAFAST